MSLRITWGDIIIPVAAITETSAYSLNIQRLTQDPEGQRTVRQGTVPVMLSTFNAQGGGLRPGLQLGDYQQHLAAYYYTQGLWTHIQRGLFLPSLLQIQNQIADGEDISGGRAANKRVHGANSIAGATSERIYFAVGLRIYRDVSTSDHAIVKVNTEGGRKLTALVRGNMVVGGNHTEVLLLGEDVPTGAIDTIKVSYYTTNPTATPIVWTALDSNLGATPKSCYGIAYLEDLDVIITYGQMYDIPSAAVVQGLFSGGTAIATSGYPLGGYFAGVPPWNTKLIGCVLPLLDDHITTNVPRRFFEITFTTALLATKAIIDTGMDNIVSVVSFLGGWAFAGDPDSNNLGKRVTFLDGNDNIRDLRFPRLNGANQMGVVSLQAQGLNLIAHCAYTNGSDAIVLLWDSQTGAWSALSPLFSKTTGSPTVNQIPLAHVGQVVGHNQRRAYIFTPDYTDSTKTSVLRYEQPVDLYANPILVPSSRHYGSLYIQTTDLDYGGPVETNKSLMRAHYLSRFASVAGGTYGTIAGAGSTDGGTTFTAWSNLFDSAFEIYNVPKPAGVVSAGLPFQTLMHQITLSNGSTTEGNATSATPNGLPLLFEVVTSEVKQSLWTVEVDFPELSGLYRLGHPADWIALLVAQENVGPVQSLIMGERINVPARLLDWSYRAVNPSDESVTIDPRNPIVLKLLQVPGTVT